jgi:transposase
MKRKKYTKEFKQEAVNLVLTQGYSQAEVVKRLGISSANITRWMSEYGMGSSVSVKKLSVEQEELIRLRQENKRLRMEREILKKAAAFFANEPA